MLGFEQIHLGISSRAVVLRESLLIILIKGVELPGRNRRRQLSIEFQERAAFRIVVMTGLYFFHAGNVFFHFIKAAEFLVYYGQIVQILIRGIVLIHNFLKKIRLLLEILLVWRI